jgi:hypothetical protein
MTPKISLLACLLALASCENKDDITTTVDRSGSIETSVTVQHADSTHDIILTTHKVWTNFKEFKTVVHKDTIPALGLISTAGENSNGDTSTVKVQKDYQIFITMK